MQDAWLASAFLPRFFFLIRLLCAAAFAGGVANQHIDAARDHSNGSPVVGAGEQFSSVLGRLGLAVARVEGDVLHHAHAEGGGLSKQRELH